MFLLQVYFFTFIVFTFGFCPPAFFVHLDCPIIAVTIFVVPVLDVIIYGDILS